MNLVKAKAMLRGIEYGQMLAQKDCKKLEKMLARKPLPPKIKA